MNAAGYSPLLTLSYVFTLLSILMGVNYKAFNQRKRWRIGTTVFLLCVGNQLLSIWVTPIVFGRLIVMSMHLPMFLLFLYMEKRGVIKTAFMILTAVVFTTPIILIGNLMRRVLPVQSLPLELLSSVVSYLIMLLLAQFVFRSSFNYLIQYAEHRFFLLFSLVPIVFYAYVLTAINLDSSSLSGPAILIIRYMPTLIVFLLYFLLPYIYKSLSEKHASQAEQIALEQKLASTEDQIALLNETNDQMAVYRHNIRHQFIVLDGLLSNGNLEQAKAFVKTAMSDLESVTPKKFCENKTANLLCSSYDKKAHRINVVFKVNAVLPEELPLSDTELSSVLSNGLENALRAASQPDVTDKWIEFYSDVKHGKLLIQIRNSYSGRITIKNGLPLSQREGHGYGCRSIQDTTQKYNGLCSFEAKDGQFTLRIILPLSK